MGRASAKEWAAVGPGEVAVGVAAARGVSVPGGETDAVGEAGAAPPGVTVGGLAVAEGVGEKKGVRAGVNR
jgi:hypothetical protein